MKVLFFLLCCVFPAHYLHFPYNTDTIPLTVQLMHLISQPICCVLQLRTDCSFVAHVPPYLTDTNQVPRERVSDSSCPSYEFVTLSMATLTLAFLCLILYLIPFVLSSLLDKANNVKSRNPVLFSPVSLVNDCYI